MRQKLVHIALLVDDYDKAIEYFTEKLNFRLLEDTVLSEEKRWVRVSPQGGGDCSVLLAKASNDVQKKQIGNQTGGRVFLFLHTDDFWRDYNLYRSKGIEFIREPAIEKHGTVAVFRDLYGNLWDLIQPSGGD